MDGSYLIGLEFLEKAFAAGGREAACLLSIFFLYGSLVRGTIL